MNNLIVGKLIKRLRQEKDWTMSDFAKKIKISQPSLSRIENGTQELSLSLLSTICEKLDISLSDFFRRLESNPQIPFIPLKSIVDNSSESSEEMERNLFTWISSLNVEQKKALYTLISPYIKG